MLWCGVVWYFAAGCDGYEHLRFGDGVAREGEWWWGGGMVFRWGRESSRGMGIGIGRGGGGVGGKWMRGWRWRWRWRRYENMGKEKAAVL